MKAKKRKPTGKPPTTAQWVEYILTLRARIRDLERNLTSLHASYVTEAAINAATTKDIAERVARLQAEAVAE